MHPLGRQLAQHAQVVAGLEARHGHQQLAAHLVQRIFHLGGAVGRVDVDQHQAHLRGGQLHQHPFGVVVRPDAHAVARHQAQAQQRTGQAVGLGLQAADRCSAAPGAGSPAPRARAGGPPCRQKRRRWSARSGEHRWRHGRSCPPAVRYSLRLQSSRVCLLGHPSSAGRARMAWRPFGKHRSLVPRRVATMVANRATAGTLCAREITCPIPRLSPLVQPPAAAGPSHRQPRPSRSCAPLFWPMSGAA